MKTRKIITALMSASALGLAIPTAAAQQNDQRGGRWGRTNAESNSVGQPRSHPRWGNTQQQRAETRAARPAPQRQERMQANVTPRAQAPVSARNEDARRERSNDRQNWRNDRRDDRTEVRDQRRDNWQNRAQVRRDDRNDWRNDGRDQRWNDRDGRRDDNRWNDRDGRRGDRHWNDRDNHKRYSWDRDWRRDQRYDWKRYRNQYRHIYHAPRYYAPRGWDYGYRRFSIGITLWSGLYGSNYWIDDPYYYRLPPAYGSLRWVRYYDDALLVDIRTGYVVDVIRDFFW